MPGFQLFFSICASLGIGKLATSNIRVLMRNVLMYSHCPCKLTIGVLLFSGPSASTVDEQPPEEEEEEDEEGEMTLNYMIQGIFFAPPMLRLFSSKAQGPKDMFIPTKPCHGGIHWIALAEYSQMSPHVPGFQYYFVLYH